MRKDRKEVRALIGDQLLILGELNRQGLLKQHEATAPLPETPAAQAQKGDELGHEKGQPRYTGL